MYEINYSKSAKRYLKKIKNKKLRTAYRDSIEGLKINPYIGEKRTGELRGVWGYNVMYEKECYELAYRVYEGSEQLVVIILAGTQKNFCKEMKRLIKRTE